MNTDSSRSDVSISAASIRAIMGHELAAEVSIAGETQKTSFLRNNTHSVLEQRSPTIIKLFGNVIDTTLTSTSLTKSIESISSIDSILRSSSQPNIAQEGGTGLSIASQLASPSSVPDKVSQMLQDATTSQRPRTSLHTQIGEGSVKWPLSKHQKRKVWDQRYQASMKAKREATSNDAKIAQRGKEKLEKIKQERAAEAMVKQAASARLYLKRVESRRAKILAVDQNAKFNKCKQAGKRTTQAMATVAQLPAVDRDAAREALAFATKGVTLPRTTEKSTKL